MIKRINDYRAEVLTQFRNGSQVGESSGLSFLDANLKIRMGYFYTVTGWPGSGKSELVLQLALLQAITAKRKCAFYSPESYPIESFIATMAHCLMGRSTDKAYQDVCSEEQYTKALDWLDEWVFLLHYDDTPTSAEVLEDFRLLRTGYSCKVFVIDPFNSLTDDDENSNMALQLKDVLSKFTLFTHTEKIIFFCIEHPRTPRDPQQALEIPGPWQLFGGSMWWNKSDCLFAIHAQKQDGKYTGDVTIKVWKMKNQKLNGRPGEVNGFFSIVKNRYYADRIFSGNAMERIEKQEDLPF